MEVLEGGKPLRTVLGHNLVICLEVGILMLWECGR